MKDQACTQCQESMYYIYDFDFLSTLSRRLKTRRSPRGEPAPRRRAQTTTRAGLRRWGSSEGYCVRRTETGGGRRGRMQTATPSCWRGNKTEERKRLRARRQISLTFTRSNPGRSSEVLMTWPENRNYRSMFVEMYFKWNVETLLAYCVGHAHHPKLLFGLL